ncbi:hypothetical protein M3J09_007816 [Ascochyta lentis]
MTKFGAVKMHRSSSCNSWNVGCLGFPGKDGSNLLMSHDGLHCVIPVRIALSVYEQC